MSRCDLLLTAEGRNSCQVGLYDSLAYEALLVGLRQVGRYLAGALASLQPLGKELL